MLVAWGALGAVYVLWGSTYLANRLVITDVPPLFTGGARFLVGGVLLGALMLVTAGPAAFRMTRAQLITVALTGLLLPAWGNGLVVLGQQYVASGIAALLIASVPLHIVLLRTATGDRPRAATFGGVGVGVVGLVVLVLGSAGGSGGSLGSAWWGPLLVLLAALGWAGGTFAAARRPVPGNPFVLAAGQMLVGGTIMMCVSLTVGERPDLAAVSPTSWSAWAYLTLVVSLTGFSAYGYALANLPVSTVSTYAYVNPVVAVLLGYLVLDERMTGWQLVGGGIVLVAVVLVVLAERPRKCQGELAPSQA